MRRCERSRRRWRSCASAAGARERELDLLEFELREIEEAEPSEAEDLALRAERDRLRHVEALRAAALAAVTAVSGEADGGADGAGAALGAAGREFDALAGVDAQLDALAERWRALVVEAEDLGAELRDYAEGLDAEPGRLDVVEERLAMLDRLARKHGGTVAAVLAHAERCRARRDELLGAEEALEDAAARLERARPELERQAAALRAARLKAAPRLAAEVRERLEALAMEGAAFEIVLSEREAGPSGADAVEFLIAPNAGVPAAPLRETASGGELSRVMLAIMAARAEAQGAGHPRTPTATLVFDEVDAGIGGQTARAVGEQLRALAERGQVVCITHLPQVASLADRHFSIAKDPSVQPARTTVTALDDADVVGELVRMLGADERDDGARRHAQELLRAA